MSESPDCVGPDPVSEHVGHSLDWGAGVGGDACTLRAGTHIVCRFHVAAMTNSDWTKLSLKCPREREREMIGFERAKESDAHSALWFVTLQLCIMIMLRVTLFLSTNDLPRRECVSTTCFLHTALSACWCSLL